MTDSDLVRRAIDASGLSVRAWARTVALREPRTVQRWLSGVSPVPAVMLEALRYMPGAPTHGTDPHGTER